MILLFLVACLADLGPRSASAFDGRCGDCHTDHTAAFATSRHAVAATSGLFRDTRESAPDPEFCDSCHAPRGGDGVSCLDCHAAAGNYGAENGQLVLDLTGPIRGSRGLDAPHASAAEPFLADSELCATCHQIDGPGAFHERPYTHWLGSAASARGEGCAECHMSPTPGVAAPRERGELVEGGPRRPIADHGFVGLLADPDALMAAGLLLEPSSGGTRITNRAGHRLPDGAAWTREIWLEGAEGRIDLHPLLLDDGRPTLDPFAADEEVFRGLEPDEVREVPLTDVVVRVRVHE